MPLKTGKDSLKTIYLADEALNSSLINYVPSWYGAGLKQNTERIGFASSSNLPTGSKAYKGTNFVELKAECLAKNVLFEDPEFPPGTSSIAFSNVNMPEVQWLRPKEISAKYQKTPEFLAEGKFKFDIRQGKPGDLWILGTLASVAMHRNLMTRIVPPNQSFKSDYAGIFRFRLWLIGYWVEVVVDDRLPTVDGEPLFLRPHEGDEFWSCLLEKAYAKLCGSYEALASCIPDEVYEDLTGGVAELIELKEATPPSIIRLMVQANDRFSIMSCAIFPAAETCAEDECQLPNGLLRGYEYGITGVKKHENLGGDRRVTLIRLRSPWGDKYKWNGRWSDDSAEWSQVPESIKKEFLQGAGSEFWMEAEDFVNTFDGLYLCYLQADVLGLCGWRKRWEVSVKEGTWKRNISAGGCRNNLDTFWLNPQYHFEVTGVDETDGSCSSTVVVALMQAALRRPSRAKFFHSIGYALYTLDGPPMKQLDRSFFAYRAMYSRSTFMNSREVTGRHHLKKGHYLIVPSTFNPREENNFLLRIFSQRALTLTEIDEKTTINPQEVNEAKNQDDESRENLLISRFDALAGNIMAVDAFELRVILDSVFKKEFKFDGFSIETCRSLVASRDADASGKIRYEEFRGLLKDLTTWKNAFLKDKECEGYVNTSSLRSILKSIGLQASNQTLGVLVTRYSGRDGRMNFDDFIHMVAKLNAMSAIFNEMSRDSGGVRAVFTLDSFLQVTMYG